MGCRAYSQSDHTRALPTISILPSNHVPLDSMASKEQFTGPLNDEKAETDYSTSSSWQKRHDCRKYNDGQSGVRSRLSECVLSGGSSSQEQWA